MALGRIGVVLAVSDCRLHNGARTGPRTGLSQRLKQRLKMRMQVHAQDDGFPPQKDPSKAASGARGPAARQEGSEACTKAGGDLRPVITGSSPSERSPPKRIAATTRSSSRLTTCAGIVGAASRVRIPGRRQRRNRRAKWDGSITPRLFARSRRAVSHAPITHGGLITRQPL